MIKKILVNLEMTIPISAVSATVEYSTSSKALAKLYRFDGDPSPISLEGPRGTIEVNVSHGRKLYLETIDNSPWQIMCSGYSF